MWEIGVLPRAAAEPLAKRLQSRNPKKLVDTIPHLSENAPGF